MKATAWIAFLLSAIVLAGCAGFRPYVPEQGSSGSTGDYETLQRD